MLTSVFSVIYMHNFLTSAWHDLIWEKRKLKWHDALLNRLKFCLGCSLFALLLNIENIQLKMYGDIKLRVQAKKTKKKTIFLAGISLAMEWVVFTLISKSLYALKVSKLWSGYYLLLFKAKWVMFQTILQAQQIQD